MNITLNGKDKELAQSQSLKEIVQRFCKDQSHVIAEVNGQIIKSPQWDQTSINDGDTIELVNFVGGG